MSTSPKILHEYENSCSQNSQRPNEWLMNTSALPLQPRFSFPVYAILSIASNLQDTNEPLSEISPMDSPPPSSLLPSLNRSLYRTQITPSHIPGPGSLVSSASVLFRRLSSSFPAQALFLGVPSFTKVFTSAQSSFLNKNESAGLLSRNTVPSSPVLALLVTSPKQRGAMSSRTRS